MTARRGAWIAGSAVALCLALLLADFFVALKRPLDSKIATERKQITAARLARKTRDDTVAWLLIASAAAFLTCAHSLPHQHIVRLHPAPRTQHPRPNSPAPSTRNPGPATASSTFVEEAVAKIGRNKEAAIPLLQAIQAHYRYLPDDVLRRVCELTEITPAEIAGTSSFYARFRRSPTGEHLIRVCHGTACHVSGARQITEELRRYLAIPEGADTDPAGRFTIDEVACLGCCSLAPVLMVDGHPAGKLTPATACEALRDLS